MKTECKLISEETSKRITSLRYLLIVFVVFIHAKLTPDIAIDYYHYDFIQPYWVTLVKEIICTYLGGAAVPLFFFFSSFLQFSQNEKYTTLLKKRSRSLLLPYLLWTLITIILFFIGQSIPKTAGWFQSANNNIRSWSLVDWIKAFTYYNFESSLKSPFVYQFWFLRELIIYIIISPIIKFVGNRIPFTLFFIISIFAVKGIPLGFTVQTSSFFFYIAGFYCAKYSIDFFKLADKLTMFEYLLLLVLAIIFGECFNGIYSFGVIYKIIACLFFLKCSKYLVQNQKIYNKLEYLSTISFFLYAIHTPFLGSAMNKITQKLIPLHGAFNILQFLLAGLLTVSIGTGLGIILKNNTPTLFAFLNGGRKKVVYTKK